MRSSVVNKKARSHSDVQSSRAPPFNHLLFSSGWKRNDRELNIVQDLFIEKNKHVIYLSLKKEKYFFFYF